MDENTPTFSPEARAELLAMYTGMAMQGLVQRGAGFSASHIGSQAVAQADATVDALEAYHVAAAKQAAADDKLLADLGVSDVSSSQ